MTAATDRRFKLLGMSQIPTTLLPARIARALYFAMTVVALTVLITGCTPPVSPDRPAGPPVPSTK